MKGVGTEEVKKLVPAEGVTLEYPVKVAESGTYRLWARIGWFRARADFEWRIGDGAWQTVPHDQRTTNLMELGFFTEASWADLGNVRLDTDTTLRIRYLKVTDEKRRMLMALDCFAFVRGPLRRWRRRRKDSCVRCGYDLQGNESGVCPECGTEVCTTRAALTRGENSK